MTADASTASALRKTLEDRLQQLSTELPIVSPLNFAVEYVFESGGKRLRPLVCMQLIQAWRGREKVDQALAVAAALELLHNASLIHDDLPALDDDAMRRGRPTCHVRFGEATALLAADMLVPMALESVSRSTLIADVRIECLRRLSRAYVDLCQGQQLDVLLPPHRGSLTTIARFKTGALFGASFALAGVVAEFSPEIIALLDRIGSNAGVCYQVGNDHLDRFGSAEEQGRCAGSDQRKAKATFFSVDSPSEPAARQGPERSGSVRRVERIHDSSAGKSLPHDPLQGASASSSVAYGEEPQQVLSAIDKEIKEDLATLDAQLNALGQSIEPVRKSLRLILGTFEIVQIAV